ncbi:hypothetical protein WNY51_17095 [Pseudocolwellia sp. AS88]|jgi:hypothetical protein|uniref:hypothetical protein n=1 Tax=Pseudocolwellia sp. AS88 TaxID=3063958 RepID=UPI0026E9BC3E|nr:hypothetical protein [Pseudocolwellia sp. AS88]MDO7085404.1 hypothetical protein [Pseudocolwellia sp. AS88]
MNINDSTYSNLTLRSAQGTQGVSKANQQAFVKPVAPAVDENNSSNQSENLGQNKTRFEVSEQAIAFLEEQNAAQSESSGSVIALRDNSNSSANSGYVQGEQSNGNAQYDQPSQQNLSAVAAYESVDNIAQRENIKQFFGVNLFA